MPEEIKLAPLPTNAVFDGIEKMNLPFDGQTFPSSGKSVFEKLVLKHKPKTIIEVGTHKGGSAVRWAQLSDRDCKIYCVDTWLEAADAVLCANKTYVVSYNQGHPLTYWQFLNNMKTMGLHEKIIPIVNTSTEAAIILKAHKVTAQIIYIDGSHSFRQAYYDMHDYWPMLESGGAMLVDDLVLYPDVCAATYRFAAENELWQNWEPVEDRTFALFTKP